MSPGKTAPTHPPGAGVSSDRTTVLFVFFRVSSFATLHCGGRFGFRPGCLTLYLAHIEGCVSFVSSSKSSHCVQHHTNAAALRLYL